jgi:hypothetical protein
VTAHDNPFNPYHGREPLRGTRSAPGAEVEQYEKARAVIEAQLVALQQPRT